MYIPELDKYNTAFNDDQGGHSLAYRKFKDFQLPFPGLFQRWCTTLDSVYLIILKH